MMDDATDDQDKESSNYTTFLDCFSSALLERIARPTTTKVNMSKKRAGRKGASITTISGPVIPQTQERDGGDEELAEFIEFLASEIFPSLPISLQSLSYSGVQADPVLKETWSSLTLSRIEDTLVPLFPLSVQESIQAYSLLPPTTSLPSLIDATLTAYVSTVTSPPPVWSATRAEACEIYERDWIPLTYHHLIPRSTHDRVLKRGWHEEWELNRVTWLCRACHSFVHRAVSNEELAREWYSVERLLEREDVRSWAGWVGRIRWKAR